MKTEPIPLKLANDNNKLACNGFIQLHFAPPQGTVHEKDFDKLYVVNQNDENIFVKLVSFARIPFDLIGTVLTIPATGVESDVWREKWLQKYQDTKPETEMAVYCYQRMK